MACRFVGILWFDVVSVELVGSVCMVRLLANTCMLLCVWLLFALEKAELFFFPPHRKNGRWMGNLVEAIELGLFVPIYLNLGVCLVDSHH